MRFAPQEALDELTLKQNEALLDNHTELQRYVALKVEYEAEVLQHGRVSRRLETKENEARSLIAKLYVSEGIVRIHLLIDVISLLAMTGQKMDCMV